MNYNFVSQMADYSMISLATEAHERLKTAAAKTKPIHAELTDGRIVPLDGPCEAGCITHTGPHWLHMDEYERATNLKLLGMAERQAKSARTYTEALMVEVYLHRFAELEAVRLQSKSHEMKRAGIVRLIEDGEA